MIEIDFNALRDRAYKCACEHGFHDKEYSIEHWLMLVITEISEAVEAERKGKHANRYMFELELDREYVRPEIEFIGPFEAFIKDTVVDELADVVIRLLDLAGLYKEDVSKLDFLVGSIRKPFDDDFIKFCYKLCAFLSDDIDIATKIYYAIANVFVLCRDHNIDLLWHIEQKMRYNELRPRLNGKKFYPPKKNNNTMNKVEKFKQEAEAIAALYEEKNKCYGDSFGDTFRKLGIVSAVTRISDKFNRLCALSTNPTVDNLGEPLEDTLRDLAAYSIMTLIELKEDMERNLSSEE